VRWRRSDQRLARLVRLARLAGLARLARLVRLVRLARLALWQPGSQLLGRQQVQTLWQNCRLAS